MSKLYSALEIDGCVSPGEKDPIDCYPRRLQMHLSPDEFVTCAKITSHMNAKYKVELLSARRGLRRLIYKSETWITQRSLRELN